MVGRTVVVAAALVGLGAASAGLAQQAAPDAEAEIAALKAEIAELRGMLPSQSHTMMDVEYNFGNLWFAGRNGDWPLATFYFNETRSHLNWAVRVRSVRKLANGSELDLRPILKGIEDSALANLKTTIDKQDVAAFEPAYRAMLTQCHACHEAAEKPYLKTQVPSEPPSVLIDMRK
ncbi:MAG TPA: hypothetical protein VFO94_15725 [Gammaproteobacteria bacterium]|nr:hypothetical protein [Gammaproteobacteria bacterium]